MYMLPMRFVPQLCARGLGSKYPTAWWCKTTCSESYLNKTQVQLDSVLSQAGSSAHDSDLVEFWRCQFGVRRRTSWEGLHWLHTTLQSMPVSNETLTTCFHVLPNSLFNSHHIIQLCKGLQSQHQTASLNQSYDIRWSRPDLTVCDNSFWGTVKEKVFQLRLTYAEDLKLSSSPVFIAFSLQRKRCVFKELRRGSNQAPRIYACNHGTTLLQRDFEFSIWTYCRGAQIFRQFSSHLNP